MRHAHFRKDCVLSLMTLPRLASLTRLAFRTCHKVLSREARITVRRPVMLTGHGDQRACVESSVWTRHHVDLHGWFIGDTLLAGGSGSTLIPCTVEAADNHQPHMPVCQAPARRFRVRTERPALKQAVVVRVSGGRSDTLSYVPPPGPFREALAYLLATPAAVRLVARHRLDILRFLLTGDAGLSVALRDAFGFNENRPAPLIPSDVFAKAPHRPADLQRPVVVIVPIHNARPHVARLLQELALGLDIDHRILLIDDGSSDPSLAPLLASFASRHTDRVSVETFSVNRGFVAAVNHGLSMAKGIGEHVILLNTDTLPPKNWASRLIAPILADPDVASVTPVSNTAEIASIPCQGVATPVTRTLVDTVDAVAARLGTDWRTVECPTGIGFAMAMNRRFLDRIGEFDPAFGRGYGEEVDWCQKASAAGGEHVLATSLFIGHEGGASFGTAEKAGRLAASASVIRSRYPGYDRTVQKWAEAAPHAVQRMILTIPYLEATSDDPVPVFLAHSLGGGAEMALRREVDTHLASGARGVVILRTGGSARWQLEVAGTGFHHACRLADSETLLKCIKPLRNRRVVYSCGAGARDPRDVPRMLLALAQGTTCSLELRFHDYFTISPSYCLLNEDGRYLGVPKATNEDPAHNLARIPGRAHLPLSEWRALWAAVIERADRITAFSPSSRELLISAYPQAADIAHVTPHTCSDTMPDRLAPGGTTIGVLGGINRAKGAEVLMALARETRRKRIKRKIVIIGGLDPAYRLPRPHHVTGRYERREISRLARRHDVGLWLIPSIWPETFSFATREALATGLPVYTFDLGAQAEAAHGAENGVALSIDPFDSTALANTLERAFRKA